MNVLFAVWELDPFFKIGGLGDVARSLPGALKKLGIDVRTITPYYKVVKFGKTKKKLLGKFTLPYAGKKETVEIYEAIHPGTGVIAYFLKNETYLTKVIDMDTWGFFDKAVIAFTKNNPSQFAPDIIHCNDLHTGLIPLLVKLEKLPIKTVLTIHNLAYQGKTSVNVISRMGIDPASCKALLWEVKQCQINFLQEAVIHADIVTTVSPSYAKEILTEEFGAGLNEILRGREGKIFGILNGIDINWRSTLHELSVKYPYGPQTETNTNGIKYLHWKEGKRKNKRLLQKKLGLKMRDDIPLLCFIGRFDPRQKGLEILHTMLRRIDQTKYEFVILGSGDRDWEERFRWLSTFYPKNIACDFRFNETLSHQLYAAADFIIIPSRYEPCGLIQMIAMLCGTIPLAHKTGGLKDSIEDGKNGFLFEGYNSENLETVVEKAVHIWRSNKPLYEQMVQNAFMTDFSWGKSAKQYISLYEKLLANML